MVSIPQSTRWSQTAFWKSTRLLAWVNRVVMPVRRKLYPFCEAEAWTGRSWFGDVMSSAALVRMDPGSADRVPPTVLPVKVMSDPVNVAGLIAWKN